MIPEPLDLYQARHLRDEHEAPMAEKVSF